MYYSRQIIFIKVTAVDYYLDCGHLVDFVAIWGEKLLVRVGNEPIT